MSGRTWLERLAERPPMGDWHRRRHHCSDVVLGGVDKPCDNGQQTPTSERKGPAVKRILSIGTVLAAVLAIALTGSAYATDTNQPEYWEAQFDATCVKYEPGDQSAPVDFWFSDGVVLSPGEYVALILKSALDNDVYASPSAGPLYVTKSGKDISHIIVCTPKEVEPSPTPEPTPTPTPSPTPSPTPTPTPTPSPSPSSSPEPSSTPTPAPSATPSVPADTPTPTAPTLTAPPTDTAPAAGASATTGSLAFPLLVALFIIVTMLLLAKAPARR